MSGTDDKKPGDRAAEATETSTGQPSRTTTVPPERGWEREGNVVTPGTPSEPAFIAPGGLIGHNDRLTEDRAREILERRFTMAGALLQRDHPFRDGALLCTLDGYDPDRTIGYAYISDADADVVSDLDAEAEAALSRLAQSGRAHVLVVHDGDVPTAEVLERRIDAFFQALPRK
jgi:hypothetical protein